MTEPHKRPAFEPAERLLQPAGYDPGMKRPVTTVAGALLVLLRVGAGVLWVLEVARHWHHSLKDFDEGIDGLDLTPEVMTGTLVAFVAITGLLLLCDLVFAVFIYLGHNWPRVIVMTFGVITIATSFASWWVQGQEITLRTSLLTLALNILVLLALSSRSAAAYAHRNEKE